MRQYFLRLSWVLALATVAAFFLPWAKLESSSFSRTVQRERIVHELEAAAEEPVWVRYLGLRGRDARAALDQPLRGESGFTLVQWTRPTAKALDRRRAAGVAEAFGVPDVRLAAVAAYAVPALALLGAALLAIGFASRLPLLLAAAASVALYAAFRYGLDHSFFERTVRGVDPGLGLWVALYGLGVGGLVLFLAAATGAGSR